jgi:hypothetical protein
MPTATIKVTKDILTQIMISLVEEKSLSVAQEEDLKPYVEKLAAAIFTAKSKDPKLHNRSPELIDLKKTFATDIRTIKLSVSRDSIAKIVGDLSLEKAEFAVNNKNAGNPEHAEKPKEFMPALDKPSRERFVKKMLKKYAPEAKEPNVDNPYREIDTWHLVRGLARSLDVSGSKEFKEDAKKTFVTLACGYMDRDHAEQIANGIEEDAHRGR